MSRVSSVPGSVKRARGGEEKCDQHPRYQGKRKPRANCEQCWRIYFALERQYWDF